MSEKNSLRAFVSSAAKVLHLWPFLAKTGFYNSYRHRKYPDTLVSLDVVITECCSLKCRNCANLMQYYHHPENLDIEETISSLGKLLKSFRIKEINILGGEPFVCQKNIIRLLDYLRSEANGRIDEIVIISNGTIIPSAECLNAMKATPKLKVLFSNYGELSSKMNELIELFNSEGIKFDVVDVEFWWDFGDVIKHEEKEKKTQHRFDACSSRRVCNSLYRGKLYYCPRQAHSIQLGIIPEDSSECVDLSRKEFDDPAVLHDAVYAFIDRKKRISTCSYCGCDKNVKIPRAVQTERPVDVT